MESTQCSTLVAQNSQYSSLSAKSSAQKANLTFFDAPYSPRLNPPS